MFINKNIINTNLDIAFAGPTCYPSSSIAAGGVAIFLIVSKAINDLLLLRIVHILDNSFRTKIVNDNSRLAEDS